MKLAFLYLFLLLFLLIPNQIFAIDFSPNLQGGCGANNISTALGCISTDDPSQITNNIITIGIGLGGGISLMLVLYGVFIITTSSGIPDKLNAGKDIIMSAISGLILITLSTVLLNLIGIKILALPGLQ